MESDLLLLGIPPAASIAALAFFGWNREMKRRFKRDFDIELPRRNEELIGAAELQANNHLRERVDARGQIAFIVVGGYGAGNIASILQAFERCGAESAVGSILFIELEAKSRQMRLDEIPEIFRSRVVVVVCPDYSIGMNGDSIKDVLGDRAFWETDVMSSTSQWMARIQAESEPGFLVVLASPGGSAALGYPPACAFKNRYPRKPIYVFTILDHKTQVRRRFPELRQLYSLDHLTRGYILLDNRRFPRRSDAAVSLVLASSIASTYVSERPLDTANALAYVFPKEKPGQFATLALWVESLPVSFIPPWENVLPPIYYTKQALFEEKAIRGVPEIVRNPQLLGVALNPDSLGRTRLVLVAAPITPIPDFQRSALRVRESLEPWRSSTDPDLHIEFASVAAPLDPTTQEVPMFIVLLTPLDASPEDVDGLALGAPIDPKFLPGLAPNLRIGQPPRKQLGQKKGKRQ